MGEVGRRGGEVRPHDAGDARGRQDPQVPQDARLPRDAPLPHRLADHRHPQDQGSDPRGRPRLREAARPGRPDPVPQPRRRPRRRLRRLEDRLRLLDELLRAGVRERRRLHDQADLRRGEGPASRPRHRVGPRRHGVPLGLRHERPRRGGPHRAGPPRARDAGGPDRPAGARLRLRLGQREDAARELPRRPAVQGGALHALQPRLPVARGPLQGRDPLLADLRAHPQGPPDAQGSPRGVRGHGDDARRQVRLQLLGLPVAARHLGDRPALPDPADPPPERAAGRVGTLADITCDSDGKIEKFIDLRDIKETLPLHALPRGRALLHRRLPHGRLPGRPRRPAQPLRRGPRGARDAWTRRAGRTSTDVLPGRVLRARARVHELRPRPRFSTPSTGRSAASRDGSRPRKPARSTRSSRKSFPATRTSSDDPTDGRARRSSFWRGPARRPAGASGTQSARRPSDVARRRVRIAALRDAGRQRRVARPDHRPLEGARERARRSNTGSAKRPRTRSWTTSPTAGWTRPPARSR